MDNFDKAVEMLVALESDYSETGYNNYIAFVMSNGFSNSEVYDHCVSENLLD